MAATVLVKSLMLVAYYVKHSMNTQCSTRLIKLTVVNGYDEKSQEKTWNKMNIKWCDFCGIFCI